MIATSSHDKTATDGHGSLLVLGLLSSIVGVGAGLIGAAFRMALGGADRARNALISWAHGSQWSGLLLVVTVISAAVALAAWLVARFAPAASGVASRTSRQSFVARLNKFRCA